MELRNARALEVIYAHFYSMPCISKLLKLLSLREKKRDDLRHLGKKIFDDGQQDFDLNFGE